ncbi:MAG: hypothetical protein PHI97_07115 [Desulfobulbus sp.]|nr:hypothetical protein [Desulfobulbus sp.]
MKKLGVVIAVMLLMHTAGCSNLKTMWSSEKDMDSVRHWEILANHVADRINKELVRKKMFFTKVYVRHSCGTPNKCGPSETFPFDEGFNDLLTSQLVNFGIHTVNTPDIADLVMEYKVQAVYHPPEQSKWNVFADQGYHELLVSTYVVDKKQYFFLCSNIYNIPQNEFWQYRTIVPAAKINLTGPTTAPSSTVAPKKSTAL